MNGIELTPTTARQVTKPVRGAVVFYDVDEDMIGFKKADGSVIYMKKEKEVLNKNTREV